MIISHVPDKHQTAPIHVQVNRIVGRFSSFSLAATASLAVSVSSITESFHSARLGAVLIVLLLFHFLRYPKCLFGREIGLYACFVGYMSITLLWTDNLALALNTLIPAFTFLIALILFGALVAFHNLSVVLAGILFGMLMGAGVYTLVSGFPFVYPADFSYNAIAGMYLFGLFSTLLFSCFKRLRVSLLLIGSVFFALTVATTSIKFNLGIVLGIAAATVMYPKHLLRISRRNAVSLIMLIAVVGYAVGSNETLQKTFRRGIDRIALGVEVLKAREDLAGYSAFDMRARWQRDGLEGWKYNPLFGHGVEAFRDRYGMTSHSTPVDLLYNFGVIGFSLFYAVYGSLVWRLLQVRGKKSYVLHALIFGGLTCYLFVSLSAPMHYNSFLAVFIAISSALLGQLNRRSLGTEVYLADLRK